MSSAVPARRRAAGWITLAVIGAVFAFLVLDMGFWQLALSAIFPGELQVVYPRGNLLQLVSRHLLLVVISSGGAILVGVGAGVFVTRPAGRPFLQTVDDLSSLGQTIPPVAVLALAVPVVGFGIEPTVVALFLYSILPILRNTISGIEAVPAEVIEAARGMGMTQRQILYRVELPLALSVIMAGIRVAVVINIGTATIGAVVGAGGLGAPIIGGLTVENAAFVLEGAVVAALLAILADQLLAQVELALKRGRPEG
jgi:osmoprotectant transport system permease protein